MIKLIASVLRNLGLDRTKSVEDPAPSLENAQEKFDNGNFEGAIAVLRQVFQHQPDLADGHRLMCAALANVGKLDEAEVHIHRAIELNPDGRIFNTTLGHVLKFKGQTEEAIACYRKQLVHTPQDGFAHFCLAQHLIPLEQTEEARALLKKAIELAPEIDAARLELSALEMNANRYEEALTAANDLLKRTPESIPALIGAARAQAARLRMVEAEILYKTALSLEPDNIQALVGLANLFLLVARGGEAESCLRLAHGIAPHEPNIAKCLVSLFLDTVQADPAEDLLSVFLIDHPDDHDFLLFSARLAVFRRDREKAMGLFERLANITPDDETMLIHMGNAKMKFGDLDGGLAIYEKLIKAHPTRVFVRTNYGFHLLTHGHFRKGLEFHESRLDLAYEPSTPYDLRSVFYALMEGVKKTPPWKKGMSIEGKRLLVWREQGLGDCIMMLRFIPLLRRLQPASVTLLMDDGVYGLADSMNTADRIIRLSEWEEQKIGERTDLFDLQCSIMSLAWLLDATLENIGQSIPYLRAPDSTAWRWMDPIRALPKPRIGLVWAGSPTLGEDKLRSLHLKQLAPILAVKGVQFVSLQKGLPQAQIKELGIDLIDPMDNCKSFADTAALAMEMDLIISVDTSVVHLVGALGLPVWMFNRMSSEWRWMKDRKDSPWYPKLRLYNQKPEEPWESVIQTMAKDLATCVENNFAQNEA